LLNVINIKQLVNLVAWIGAIIFCLMLAALLYQAIQQDLIWALGFLLIIFCGWSLAYLILKNSNRY
jgi:hypothetical protein